ncbi:alpha/beta fold hydrolase [Nonomuraea sp. NPDC048826]|uniref:alpha/beta fold hydrolase n=1 Tax=Nonomuraea sp. NPDC048826 TaxID=3364347 RepID=UPI00371580B7
MTDLTFTRGGRGEPLVLLHGIGASKSAWRPVLDGLAERFDVIAVDLPGFGDSPELPAGVEPVPAALAAAVAAFLDRLGIGTFHIAGHSLGAWVALETAKLREARSVTLLCPAGLWGRRSPWYAQAGIWASRWLTRKATGPMLRAVSTAAGRTAVLGQTHGRPWALDAGHARDTILAMARCPGFEATMRAASGRRFLDGAGITAPVTVAFGARDLILPTRGSRRLDQLPPTVRTVTLRRCGHVPMNDDPAAVIDAIASKGS